MQHLALSTSLYAISKDPQDVGIRVLARRNDDATRAELDAVVFVGHIREVRDFCGSMLDDVVAARGGERVPSASSAPSEGRRLASSAEVRVSSLSGTADDLLDEVDAGGVGVGVVSAWSWACAEGRCGS